MQVPKPAQLRVMAAMGLAEFVSALGKPQVIKRATYPTKAHNPYSLKHQHVSQLPPCHCPTYAGVHTFVPSQTLSVTADCFQHSFSP